MISLKKNILLSRFQRFIEKTIFANPEDKRYESDRQMLQRIASKYAVFFFVILMFDTLLDWFLGLIDIVIHLIHLVIEAIEYMFELLLSNTLHTTPQQSEMIIVNATIIIALYLAYRLMLAVPGLTIRVKQYLLSVWSRFLKRESSCWRAMSLSYKVKWLSAYSFGTACFLLFI